MAVIEGVATEQLDKLAAEAREVRPGVATLAVIATVLIAFGRCIGIVVTAFTWSYVAVRAGYRDVRPPRPVKLEREARGG